jgi:cytoskeleton protein RodZ
VAVVVIGAAGAYAYQSGLIPASLFERKEEEVKPAETPALETTLLKPGQDSAASAPLQSPNVPLISVPPQVVAVRQPRQRRQRPPLRQCASDAGAGPGGRRASACTGPGGCGPSADACACACGSIAGRGGAGHQLVLKVTEDSWVEIRRPGTTSLISRVVAGSTGPSISRIRRC